MEKNLTASQVLAELLRDKWKTNPELAAKQRHLLEILKNGTSFPQPDGSSNSTPTEATPRPPVPREPPKRP